MRGAAGMVVSPRLAEAQGSVDRLPHFGGIVVFLAVVLPPAHRAQLEAFRRLQGSVATAGAAETIVHIRIDAYFAARWRQNLEAYLPHRHARLQRKGCTRMAQDSLPGYSAPASSASGSAAGAAAACDAVVLYLRGDMVRLVSSPVSSVAALLSATSRRSMRLSRFRELSTLA